MTVRSTVRLCIVSNDNECIPICCSNLHCNSYNRAIQVINMKNDGGEADNLALPAKGLPNPKTLRWAHSTCSKDDLEKALLDEDINAIEADIVMGHHHKVEEEDNEKTTDENEAASSATTNSIRITEPIMAHPPNSISDLSFEGFIHRCMMKEEDSTTKDCSRQPRQHHYKHLKLDFKDVETIEPALNTLNKSMIIDNNDENNSNSNLTSTTTSFDKSIFLNADILKGPGCNTRNQQLAIIDAEIFMEKCLAFINSLINQEEDRKRIIMSLGWKVDCRSFYGYTDLQVKEMKDLIEKYDIMKRTGGVVLAVNARVLAKDPKPFDSILKEYPEIQLLIWTGTGEPHISRSQISSINNHFKSIGCEDQIGLDCQVASTEFSGMFYDSAVRLIGVFWNARNYILDE